MNSNDKFYDMFKESFEGFAPEVPGRVYSGVRAKMRRNNFFRFSVTSLNIWTLTTLIILGGSVLHLATTTSETYAKRMIKPSLKTKKITNKSINEN